MAQRKALTLIGGRIRELPAGDTLAGAGGGGLAVVKFNAVGPLTPTPGKLRWYPERDCTITAAYFSLGLAGTDITEFDVKKNGVSIFTTKPSTLAGQYKSSVQTVSVVMTTSDYLTVDITQGGSAADAVLCITYQ